MFDPRKAQQLQNRSHVRGKLNKEFYSSEQEQLQRKRRQMKAILDQQVEQRKRQKEKERLEIQRKTKKEEEQIRAYYAHLEDRERPNNNINSTVTVNNSNQYPIDQPLMSFAPTARASNGVYNSKVSVNDQKGSRVQQQQPTKNRSNSKKLLLLDPTDIPVIPVMQINSNSPRNNESHHPYNQSLPPQSQNYPVFTNHLNHHNSAGKIPLLQLAQEQQIQNKQRKDRKRSKGKRKEIDDQKQSRRRPSMAIQEDQPMQVHPGKRQNTQLKQVFGDLNEELQNQNRELKNQLKKNQQAISLLIGAVRSNGKLDKYRIQAEKILRGQELSSESGMHPGAGSREKKPGTRNGETQKQKQLMLPKLKMKHQSIMHDYMFGSAKKAHQIKSKTFK